MLIEGAWTYRMLARSAESSTTVRRSCRQLSATLPGRPNCGSAPVPQTRSCRKGGGCCHYRDRARDRRLHLGNRGVAQPAFAGIAEPQRMCATAGDRTARGLRQPFQLHRPGGSGLGGSSATTDSLYLRMQPCPRVEGFCDPVLRDGTAFPAKLLWAAAAGLLLGAFGMLFRWFVGIGASARTSANMRAAFEASWSFLHYNSENLERNSS